MAKLRLTAQIGLLVCHRPGPSAMSLMLSICTSDAVVLSTTSNHLEWLGRDRNGVIGHRCSEWASAQYWDLNWHLFKRSLSTGATLSWERSVVRLDGSVELGQLAVKPLLTRRHGLIALCANRPLKSQSLTSLEDDMQRCLSEVSGMVGRTTLRHSLEELAADMARAAEKSFGPRH